MEQLRGPLVRMYPSLGPRVGSFPLRAHLVSNEDTPACPKPTSRGRYEENENEYVTDASKKTRQIPRQDSDLCYRSNGWSEAESNVCPALDTSKTASSEGSKYIEHRCQKPRLSCHYILCVCAIYF